MRAARAVAATLSLAAAAAAAGAAEYRFDLSEIEARAWELGGFVEAKAEHFRLRPDAPLYPLAFAGRSARETLDRASLAAELAGQARHETLTAYARAAFAASDDAFESRHDATLLEGGLRVSPREGLSVDVGKQVQRWGKGYAWNPVGFFERAKDPSDPTASREGFVMASAAWVRRLPGTVAAIGFAPLLLPVATDLNGDYGEPGHVNPGARLTLLVADTDLDLLWAAKGSRPQRIGVDFSRNLGSQLELHGEWARAFGATRQRLAADGSVHAQRGHLDSWLLGARFLSERDVTWIVERYRQGGGAGADELERFHALLTAAFAPAGTAEQRTRARSLARSGYGGANPGRDYAYLRVSAKDPFDWLYLSPALSAIVNLGDRSRQLVPELLYTGWQNLELRARALLAQGRADSEFGAKAASRRVELQLRLYF